MKRIKITFGFLLVVILLQAQSDFKPGYVIKSIGDTLFGEINNLGYIQLGKICIFRNNAKEKATNFYPNNILAYRFIDGKYFISKEVNNKKVYLEFLIKGRLNIYHYRDNSDHYYLEKDSVPLTELLYKDIIKEDDTGKEYIRKNNKYIGLLNYYLNDAPELQTEINSIKIVDPKNLITLAENYHKAVCDGDKCIVYEKKLPPLKVNLEITGWFVSGKNNNDYSQLSQINGSVTAHIWLPNISEKIYFRTGFCYLSANYINNYYLNKIGNTLIYIPVQFEYIYPKGIIRPKIAVGLCFGTLSYKSYASNYKPYTTQINFFGGPFPIISSLSITAGLNIKFTKAIFGSINYDLISGPSTGLYFQL